MQYSFICDCGYTRIYVCRIKDYPSEVPCDKCDKVMYRNYKDEGTSFILKGSCWARDEYGMTHRGMVEDLNNETKRAEKENIKKAKEEGVY